MLSHQISARMPILETASTNWKRARAQQAKLRDIGAASCAASANMSTVVIYGRIETKMREIQLKDAKATLSSVVDDAVRGKPAIITRHGKREAVVLGFKEWERLASVPSFGQLLMSAPVSPGDLPRRNRTPIRRVKL
jgi:antitoxin Phd